MDKIRKCAQGHQFDSVWNDCPYCTGANPEETVTDTPAIDPSCFPIGWLIILDGVHAGSDFRIGAQPLVLGSQEDCDIVLSDSFTSGRHARIEGLSTANSVKVLVTDLGSTNGTFVELPEEDQAIDQHEVDDGTVLIFGETRAVVQLFKPIQAPGRDS